MYAFNASLLILGLTLIPFILKGAMRVIITARSTFATGYERVLQRLVAILGVISKNPSNPNFDQYIFESISALMRYVSLVGYVAYVKCIFTVCKVRCSGKSGRSPYL